MPRDGNGVYSKPAGIDASPDTTIESADWNSFTADVEQDLNTARPIVAGGTGKTTAVAAADALSTQGSNIASASTTNLALATGVAVTITGTTTINAFGTVSAGAIRILTFAGALTLTHNGTSLIIPGGADVTTAAGDTAELLSLGSGNWRVVRFTRAATIGNGDVTLTGTQTLTNKTISGGSVTGITDLAIADGGTGQSTAANAFNALKQAATDTATGVVELATAAEVTTGTDTGRVPSVATMKSHQGMAKAWVNFNGTGTVAIQESYNVSSITDNGTGDYTINFATALTDANYAVALSSRILAGAGGGGTCRILAATAPTASALRFDTLNYSGTLADPVLVTATVFR